MVLTWNLSFVIIVRLWRTGFILKASLLTHLVADAGYQLESLHVAIGWRPQFLTGLCRRALFLAMWTCLEFLDCPYDMEADVCHILLVAQTNPDTVWEETIWRHEHHGVWITGGCSEDWLPLCALWTQWSYSSHKQNTLTLTSSWGTPKSNPISLKPRISSSNQVRVWMRFLKCVYLSKENSSPSEDLWTKEKDNCPPPHHNARTGIVQPL